MAPKCAGEMPRCDIDGRGNLVEQDTLAKAGMNDFLRAQQPGGSRAIGVLKRADANSGRHHRQYERIDDERS